MADEVKGVDGPGHGPPSRARACGARRAAALIVAGLAGLFLAGVGPGTEVLARPQRAPAPGFAGPKLIHYRLRCHPGESCRIECSQGGRLVVSRTPVGPDDRAKLVFDDGFTGRLVPLWLELAGPDGSAPRTILLPGDVLCDLQGLTIEPLE